MAAFTTVGSGWLVEDLGDELYPVFAVWSENGKKFFGVAGGEGMVDLLESAAIGLAKAGGRRGKSKVGFRTFRFVCVRVGPGSTARVSRRRLKVVVGRESTAGHPWRVVDMRDVRPEKLESRKH